MYDNYNYPPGADTPDAPWNQPSDPDPIDVRVDVGVALSCKNCSVYTDNYWIEADNEGYTETHLEDGYADIKRLYTEQHKSIPELLAELCKYINGELAGGNVSRQRKEELEQMLEDAEGWQVDDVEIDDYEAID